MNIYSYIENSHEEIKRINELDALILSETAHLRKCGGQAVLAK